MSGPRTTYADLGWRPICEDEPADLDDLDPDAELPDPDVWDEYDDILSDTSW